MGPSYLFKDNAMKRITQASTQGKGQDKVMGSREGSMKTKEEGLSPTQGKMA